MTLLRFKRRLRQFWLLSYIARSDRRMNRCYYLLYKAMGRKERE